MAEPSKLEQLQSRLQKAHAEYVQAFQDVCAEWLVEFERNTNLWLQAQKSCPPTAGSGTASQPSSSQVASKKLK